MRKKTIYKGDKVKVLIPDDEVATARMNGDLTIPVLATKYNGKEMIVSRKRTYYNARGNASGHIYELAGAKSSKGISYTFIAAWLEVI